MMSKHRQLSFIFIDLTNLEDNQNDDSGLLQGLIFTNMTLTFSRYTIQPGTEIGHVLTFREFSGKSELRHNFKILKKKLGPKFPTKQHSGGVFFSFQ